MRRLFPVLAAAAIAATPAMLSSAAPDWSRAARVEVRLASFSYSPKSIRLRAGQPVILHLVNTSSGGHDFTARQFFAAAAVRPQDRSAIAGGSVEVRSRQSRDIALVPRAGSYPLKCGHTLHKTFGMSGQIIVE